MLSMAQVVRGCVSTGRGRVVIGFLAVFLLAGALYFPTLGCDFSGLDDQEYVSGNPYVLNGFVPGSLKYAWVNVNNPYWHPLTWLSLMLDGQMFGPGPAGFHFTNFILHALAAGVLFLVLASATACPGPSFLAALLFAVHPLNVEAVAWVAERKTVLAGLFYFLAVGAYVFHARRPSVLRMGLACLALALGLMAKPMLVTLPFALLLLDWWPLRRLGPDAGSAGFAPASPGRLVLEKTPLFILSAASLVVSFLAQAYSASDMAPPGLAMRAGMAVLAYPGILGRALWPAGLAVFYPAPASLQWFAVLAAATGLALATWGAFRAARNWPWLTVGWLWFLGVLVPTLGLVQAGYWPRYADRFAYVSLVGCFVAVAFSADELVRRRRGLRPPVLGAAWALILALAVVTGFQITHWKNPEVVFSRALAVTQGNWLAHDGLGHVLLTRGQMGAAEVQFRAALAARPEYWDALLNLGTVLASQKRFDEAMANYQEAFRLVPRLPEPLAGMANVLAAQGNLKGAWEKNAQAIRLDPTFLPAYVNLAVVQAHLGRPDLAERVLLAALQVNPRYGPALGYLKALRSRPLQ